MPLTQQLPCLSGTAKREKRRLGRSCANSLQTVVVRLQGQLCWVRSVESQPTAQKCGWYFKYPELPCSKQTRCPQLLIPALLPMPLAASSSTSAAGRHNGQLSTGDKDILNSVTSVLGHLNHICAPSLL